MAAAVRSTHDRNGYHGPPVVAVQMQSRELSIADTAAQPDGIAKSAGACDWCATP
jgi:hypothetical protein